MPRSLPARSLNPPTKKHQAGGVPRLVPWGVAPALLTLHALAQLAQRLALDLADALARQAEALADLLEGLRLLVVQAETHAEHGGLALVHLVEQLHDVVEVVGLDHFRVGRL